MHDGVEKKGGNELFKEQNERQARAGLLDLEIVYYILLELMVGQSHCREMK